MSGQRLPPERLYLLHVFLYNLFQLTAAGVSILYQVEHAGLNPLQIVTVGTVLQGTRLIFEIPTGVLADTRGRKISIVIGVAMAGAGYVFIGAIARYETILLAQVVLGLGLTFISGAQQAWIADEVGPDRALRVYMRSAQVAQVARFAAIPVSVVLGLVSLQIPLLVGGGLLVALAAFLALFMTEAGFTPAGAQAGTALQEMAMLLRRGTDMVRSSRVLAIILIVVVFYQTAGEGFTRLYTPHFLDHLGFPSVGNLAPVVWLGGLRMGASILSLGAVEFGRRKIDMARPQEVTRWLTGLNLVQLVSLVVFGFAGNFYVGALAYWAANIPNSMFDPLYLSWINQSVDSRIRATVISMSQQTAAFGQILGAPVIGAVGTFASTGYAMFASAVALLPVFALYQMAGAANRTRPPSAPDSGSPVRQS